MNGSWTPVVESMDRGYSSISYWTYRDDGVEIGAGRVSVEHGKPKWPEALSEPGALEGATVGKLWRLGNNKWTTLDTQLELSFRGQAVAKGIYYIVLARPTPEEWRMVFVSPKEAAERRLDAWAAQARPGEIPTLFEVPLRYTTGETKDELDISLALDEGDMSKGTIRIEWGPHRLEAEFGIDVPSPTFYRTEPSASLELDNKTDGARNEG
jgi:hypothetical protein